MDTSIRFVLSLSPTLVTNPRLTKYAVFTTPISGDLTASPTDPEPDSESAPAAVEALWVSPESTVVDKLQMKICGE